MRQSFFIRALRWLWRKFKPAFEEWLSAVRSYGVHFKYSFNDAKENQDLVRLKYQLVKHAHIVEKGMALPEPRYAFGQPKIRKIISLAVLYESLGGDDVSGMVRDVIKEYRRFNERKEEMFEPGLIKQIDDFIAGASKGERGGVKPLKRSQWEGYSLDDFDRFISFRHSVRDFDDQPVDPDFLKSVVAASLKTPSVCNRQGWFVHCYEGKGKINRLLSYQNGNAGFSQCIDKLLVVTGNIKAFTRHEHNQLFVDGGLVSMNLMLAIHSAGLGACPLNTCMPYHKEKQVLKEGGMSSNERLIMMIAVGNLKDEFVVATSEKYKLEKVLVWH